LDEEVYPAWSLGWTPLPDYIKSLPTEIVDMKKRHAREFMQVIRDILKEEIQIQTTKATAHKQLVKIMYGDDQPGLKAAEELTANLLKDDHATSVATLNRTYENIKTENCANPIMVTTILMKGPGQYKNTKAQPVTSVARGRDTSRQAQFQQPNGYQRDPSRGRGRGRGRGQAQRRDRTPMNTGYTPDAKRQIAFTENDRQLLEALRRAKDQAN
jgi:hypothetical protein